MRQCVQCGHTGLASARDEHAITIDWRTFTAEVPIHECPSCGDEYVDGSTLDAIESEAERPLADAGGISGETFWYMRRVLGMSIVTLGGLLDVAPETIARWEGGTRPVDRDAWILLAALVSDRTAGMTTTLDLLGALRGFSRAGEGRASLGHRA